MNNLNNVKKFLLEAKKIMNGEEFSELRGSQKREIFKLFMEMDAKKIYDWDGNLMACLSKVIEEKDAGMNIRFWSASATESDFPDRMYDLVITAETGKYWEDISIDQAIDYIDKYLINVVPLGILNTSILTAPGQYELRDITLEEARHLASNNKLDSAVGHVSTAEIMTTLLGVEIPVNRQMFQQQKEQQALVFKLNGRPEEGKILSTEEISEIGYKFQLLVRNV